MKANLNRDNLKNGLIGFLGAGLGAGAMYYSDPDRGRYRRALIRDRLVHWRNVAQRKSRIAYLDLTHRSRGQVAELRGRIFRRDVNDDVLVARVAARLGRLVSAPHPIQLTADKHVVTLSGPIFEDELDDLIAGISKVPGVERVINQLQLKRRTEKDPPRRNPNAPRKQWTPSTQLIATLGSTLFGIAAIWTAYQTRSENRPKKDFEAIDDSLAA